MEINSVLNKHGRCINQFCESPFCGRHNPRPTVWEERWKIKRLLGYTFILYIPRNHFRLWKILAVFLIHDDAREYLKTL